MEKITLGSVYLDGRAREPGFVYSPSCDLWIGNTNPTAPLRWNKLENGLMVAQECLFTNVSWDWLDEHGFVFGTVIHIDGKPYLIRCLKCGATEEAPNEWEVALEEAGARIDLWHWRTAFWGQESPAVEGFEDLRVVRGGKSARAWSRGVPSISGSTGFRPALEALLPVPDDFGALMETTIALIGPGYDFVWGQLVYATDYDLVLEHPSPLPDECRWAIPDGKHIIVERKSVKWLRGM